MLWSTPQVLQTWVWIIAPMFHVAVKPIYRLLWRSLRRRLRIPWLGPLRQRRGPPPQPQILEILTADYVIPIGEAVVQIACSALARGRVASVSRRLGGIEVHHHKQIAVIAGRPRSASAGGHLAEAQRVQQAVGGL